ncbi:multidrug effflux MFS transporter [Methylobacterium sp. E-066]|uniref:multidrug effflux MFS transporter n=1 Tax=Methylobacterium sp. E-066 TaxID=2836584 RepID=UPI001FB8B528|nr:multidrug effflux MFS transporter [Methylobacterium sp. E-066]MCJ2138559.1 multidrug effflux MFS transporter [Methylobacterium sp. E-066]
MLAPPLILVIAVLSSFGLLASDVYVPAMPAMTQNFGIANWQMPQTVSAYLIALAVAQLVYGPLSDRWGRKPVLVVGILLYIAGSIGCAVASSFAGFLVWRMLEGCGAASGLVLGRAIIADTCDRTAAAKVYSIVYPFVSLSPALAPAVGASLAKAFGWQADFLFVAAFGVLALILTVTLLPETRPAGRPVRPPFEGFSAVLKDRKFRHYTLMVCAIYSAWFVYLTQSAFVFDRLGLSETSIGWLYLPLTGGIIGANQIARRLLDRLPYDAIVALGVACFLAGGCAFLATLAWPGLGAAALVLPMLLVSLANGSSMSLAIAGAIASEHGRSAVASGLIGFFQIASSSLVAFGASAAFGMSQDILVATIFGLALVAALAAAARLSQARSGQGKASAA